MARLLGEARVSILPDGTRFRPEAEAAVKKATAGISGKIKLDFDSKGMRAQAAAAAAEIIAQQNRIAKAREADEAREARSIAARTKMYAGLFDQISRGEADQAKQESALAKARNAAASVLSKQINTISKQQSDAADNQLRNVQKVKDAQDKAWTSYGRNLLATEKLEAGRADNLKKQAANLSKDFEKIRVNLETARAEAQGVSLREKLKAILSTIKVRISTDHNSLAQVEKDMGGFFGNIKKKIQDSGSDSGGSFVKSMGASIARQNPLITAGVVAGLAALPAAIGAVGVLGGIALGAGLMYGAEKLINSRLKSLTTQIKQQTAILNSKTSTPAEKKAAQDLINQDLAQVAALNKEKAAFQQVNAAVGRLKNAFLDFAIVATKPLIKPFSDALDYLSKQLKGPLGKEFADLFRAVGPLIKPVLVALLEIVRGVLPGLTFLLNKARGPLGDLFVKFGKIVGLRVGDWFRAAAPYIKVSSDYFLLLVDALGKTVTWLIIFGGKIAKIFTGSQFKGFGAIIGKLAGDLLKIVIPAFQGWADVMVPLGKVIGTALIPLLDFLVAHPEIVKIVAGFAAAWVLVSKGLVLARAALIAFDVVMAIADVLMDANPAGLLALSIEALVVAVLALTAAMTVGVVEIIKHWSGIATFFTGIWKHIWSGFIGPVINFFTNSIPHAFSVTIDWVKKNFPLLPGIVADAWGHVANVISGIFKPIASVVEGVWNGILKTTESIGGHIASVVSGVFKPIASVVGGVWREMLHITAVVWGGIWKVIRPIALIILGLIGEAWIGIRNLTIIVWHAVYNNIVTPLKKAWDWVNKNFLGPIEHAFKVAWDTVSSFTSHAFSVIYNAIVHGLQVAWNWVNKNFLGPIQHAFKAAWDFISSWTVRIFTTIYNTIAHWLTVAWNWVNKNFLQPIQHAFKVAWDFISSWTSRIFHDVYGWISHWLDVALKWVNRNFLTPIRTGFSLAMGFIRHTVQLGFDAVRQYIISPLQKAWDWVSHKFVGGIEGAFNGLVGTVKKIWTGLKHAVADPINFVISKVWNPFAHFVNKGLKIFHVASGLDEKVGQIKFAKGGHVPGYAPGKDVVHAMLSPGEFVLRPEVVKNVGVKNLHALNDSGANPRFGQDAIGAKTRAAIRAGAPPLGNLGLHDKPKFADGGTIEKSMLSFMLSKKGQTYSQANRWGEPPWDCSSLVWEAAHHAGVPIPKSEAIANREANWFRNSSWAKASHDYAVLGRSQIQPGDILFMSGASPDPSTFGGVGHVGMALGPDNMISALDSHDGVTTSNIGGFQGAIRLGGPGGKDILAALGSAALGGLSFILKPLAQLALDGVQKLADGALNHLPGAGPFHDLPKAVIDKIINAAKNSLTGNQDNYDSVGGGGPAGGVTGAPLANMRQGYQYLLANLFGGHKIAAGGAVASIYGESGWNPFARGSGGRGLIGWTPEGTISDAAFKGGMKTQLPEILNFVHKNGDMGVINQMNKASSVLQAANEWGRGVERFGINDVHPFAVRLAEQIIAGMANGGQVFDSGGTLKPGRNVVYNLTGKPEHLTRTDRIKGGGNVSITLELGPKFKRQTGLTDQELADIRYTVRTAGGGSTQKAFGKPGVS